MDGERRLDPEQAAHVRERYAAKRKAQLLLIVPVLAMVPLLILAKERQEILGIPSGLVRPVAFAVVVAGVLFSLYNWRCPSCGRYLGRSLAHRFCPSCGVPLR